MAARGSSARGLTPASHPRRSIGRHADSRGHGRPVGVTRGCGRCTATTIAPGDSRLAERLRRNIAGEVLFDRADRGRYATDASIYQIEPLGVIVPKTIDDVAAALAIAREEGIPVLPRGGGTSQCGQTVNRALVIDCSKHLRRVLHVDAAARHRPGRAGHRARRI